jgi:hypothetical protein
VEHIVAHKSDPALKFDWDNLFIACWHCNNIKSTKYDDIINPVLINPEECIALSVRISDNFIEAVQVIPLKTDAQALKTAELLEIVYNGGSTAMKKVESANLRNEHLLPDIKLFLKYISDYIDEPDLGYDSIIRQEISCSAKFAAFKRRIIAEDTELSVAFADALA